MKVKNLASLKIGLENAASVESVVALQAKIYVMDTVMCIVYISLF